MRAERPVVAWYGAIAIGALVLGFLLSAQVRSALAPASDRIGRNSQLLTTVNRLKADNVAERRRVADLRAEIATLELGAAQRSDGGGRGAEQVGDLRARAALTPLHGPGVVLTLADGKGPAASKIGVLDVQDAVTTLFAGGAEGVAVNGSRISPVSRFQNAGNAVVIDDGSPLSGPFRIEAVGDRAAMSALLEQPATLGDLKRRQSLYSLQLLWTGSGDLRLPGYDSTLPLKFAHAPQS
jgi:uncharacterized protein YlxW (UPF0749 family)